ncbi:MAG: septal ring lytic transglycosylase RlpA family protein [Sphingomonadaceae bacterium]|nr:septal ring lytic transglycosylase RlpA family protein [Sphingomonadaceae bacterium]
MQQRKHSKAGLVRVAVAVALATALPASVFATPSPAEQDAAFVEHFAPYDTAPNPMVVPAGAVDLGDIDIPVEAEPEPAMRGLGSGIASYYGKRFAGRKTANGERFDPGQMTAAHKTLPFGSKVRVTHEATGKSVIVRINDRGPYVRGRMIDLSRAAAEQIGIVRAGHGRVTLELIES